MFFFEGYFTWLCTFALMVSTPSPIYVLKIGIAHKHNMVWCEINMQGLPFPWEEKSPTLRGSGVGRGDTHDGTCGWAHGGTMAGREGTLRYAKRDDGSVRVWLDGVDDRLDADQPSKQPPGWPEARHRLDDLIDAKDEALRDLRDQLEHMRRDLERKDAIIMQMAQANSALAARVPELEAASGQREAPEMSSEEADKGITLQDQDEPQRRSWLYRLLIHT
jgi:hypothetical protein